MRKKERTIRLEEILCANGLMHELLSVFLEQGIADSILETLTDADLKELGVSKIGDRKRLLIEFSQSDAEADSETDEWIFEAPQGGVFRYCAKDGGTTINRYRGEGDVVIPSRLGDMPFSVRAIARKAFINNGFLTGISIPDSVRWIGEQAFAGCSSLTSITIPNSVMHLGEQAFAGCRSLTGITVPGCLVDIARGTFADCKALTSINIPDKVWIIGKGAFERCTGLSSITIPDKLMTIGEGAFSGCKALTSINIPDSVWIIEKGAFEHCTGLTSITIPNAAIMGDDVFSGCSSLREVVIPRRVKKRIKSLGINQDATVRFTGRW